MLKILFWGTGSYAFKWMTHNSKLLKLISYQVVSRTPVQTKLFCNEPIIRPEDIKNFSYDYLCILSVFFEDIKNDAVKTYNVEEKKIITAYELETKLISESNWKNLDDEILLRHIAHSRPELSLLRDYSDYTYIKNTYQKYIENWVYISQPQHNTENKIIWICWFQGYENAPPIVKACINSVKKYMGDTYEVKLITENNMKNYIKFPDHILEKYRKGYMSRTHLSDLLRAELLITYGGIWIDATVLLTSPIPPIIQNSEFFVFRFDHEIEPRIASSWFIVAKPYNKILMLTRDLLYQYWRDYDLLFHYYLFHYFFRIAVEKFPEEWKPVIMSFFGNNRTLTYDLFRPWNEEQMDYYKEISFCQKLTYKLDIPKEIEGTFYKKILDEYSNISLSPVEE